MAVYPFTLVNRRGSAAIESVSVTVNTDNVVFSFQNHAFVNSWYRGTIFVNIAQSIPTGTTGTLPVVFSTNGATQAVTKFNGEALTVADLPGTGVYEFWFDRATNTLQIMTGIV
jgi:hypothetical protein|nr:MAG TPA: hypothetical protein [Caudoviricetes sp.]